MIVDTKYTDLFPVKISRVVLDIDHEAITEYTLDHQKNYPWGRYTTFHDPKCNDDWMKNLPDRDKFEDAAIEMGVALCEETNRKELKNPYLWYWVSIYDENDQHGSHNHPGSLLSGTYWPSADRTSSPILLEAPWQNYTMHDRLPTADFLYKPNPGDMLMWPSWIDHRVHNQPTPDKPRIAISFNLDYDWASIRPSRKRSNFSRNY